MSAHKTLAEALVALQADLPALPKDGVNPHFKSKFTKLDTIRERVGPHLATHGLTWQTFPCIAPDGNPALRYRLTHSSGEFQEDVMPLLLAKNDAQGLGSAITYARRYAVTAVLDLVADEDDDGQRAVTPRPAPPAQAPVLAKQIVDELVAAKQATGRDDEWVRQQLVAIGVVSVPAGKVTLATIRALTEQQALRLLERFEAVTDNEDAAASVATEVGG